MVHLWFIYPGYIADACVQSKIWKMAEGVIIIVSEEFLWRICLGAVSTYEYDYDDYEE
jgi:hypothetical protein